MAEALVSLVLERLVGVAEQQIREHVNLVVGVDDEIESLKHTLQSIQDVLEDAERKQVKEISVQRWLEELKDVAYQIDDVVDEWIASLLRLQIEPAETTASSSSSKKREKKKVSCSCLPSPFFCFKQVASRHAIALKIESIKQQVDAIDTKRKMFESPLTKIEKPQHLTSTSVIDVSEVCGREMDEKTITDHLLGKKGKQRSGLYIVSIVGTGGLGKTTLAQLAYNHLDVKARFDERIWVCVSDPFEPDRIFRHIVEHFTKQPCQLQNLGEIQEQVRTHISGKEFLLVLDDVWTDDFRLWDQVKNTFSSVAGGSRILVTTRKESVVKMMRSTHNHQLGGLSQKKSRALFSQIAFSGMSKEKKKELKSTGERIADRCRGLPLAIKSMGNLMRSKNSMEEWEAVLNNELWQEEAFERDISPALWLSFYSLPSPIRRCFSFCAVFPKDTVIERDELIELWMAHNYLKPNGNKEMEMIGREYFEHLAAASFFQDFKKDEDNNIIKCKMHDIVHDFAQLLTKGECFIIENDKQSEKLAENCRHATFVVKKDGENAVSPSYMKNLHTLLVFNSIYGDHGPLSFQHLTCLRALSLGRRYFVEKLPDEVGDLMHLRYLDLSNCRGLKELPETICNLHNLQTLKIRGCSGLERLPQAIGKLTNLRHLQNGNYFGWSNKHEMPKGMRGLKSLQTLEHFIISRDGDKKCKIGDLRNLNKLRGELTIEGLNEVEDAREMVEAELEKKIHIQKLVLVFGRGETTKEVAEAIKLPPKLRDLAVITYEDAELPGWMMRLSTLTHLRRLELSGFLECSGLPPCGELPALQHLEITLMASVKYVGDEFVRSSSIAFPKLKQLSFKYMENWENWEVEEDQPRSIMPSLKVLELICCPKLEALPDILLGKMPWFGLRGSMRPSMPDPEIWIQDCPVLTSNYPFL